MTDTSILTKTSSKGQAIEIRGKQGRVDAYVDGQRTERGLYELPRTAEYAPLREQGYTHRFGTVVLTASEARQVSDYIARQQPSGVSRKAAFARRGCPQYRTDSGCPLHGETCVS